MADPTAGASPVTRRRPCEDGSTLVKLLVVVVILGILSAVVVFAARGRGDKSRAAAVAQSVPDGLCGGQVWAPATWCTTGSPGRGLNGTGGAYNNRTKMVQLTDGRIFTGGSTFDPVAGIWTNSTNPVDLTSGPPRGELPDGSLGNYPPLEMVVLKDNAATPESECSAPNGLDNCGKVLVYFSFAPIQGFSGWELFDPATNGGKGSWEEVLSKHLFRSSNARGAQILGTPAECGTTCGKVLLAGGTTDGAGKTAQRPELYDPKTNEFTPIDSASYRNDMPDDQVYPLPGGKALVITRPDRMCPETCQHFRVFSADSFAPTADSPRSLTFENAPVALADGTMVFIHKTADGLNKIAIRRADGTWDDLGAQNMPDTPCPDYDGSTSHTCRPVSALPGGKVMVALVSNDGNVDNAGRTFVFDPAPAPGSGSPQWQSAGMLSYQTPSGYMPSGGILITGDPCGTRCNMVLAANPQGYSNPQHSELFKP